MRTATIRLGSSGRSLSMAGATWDLEGLTRPQVSDLSGLLCTALGITEKKPAKARTRAPRTHA